MVTPGQACGRWLRPLRLSPASWLLRVEGDSDRAAGGAEDRLRPVGNQEVSPCHDTLAGGVAAWPATAPGARAPGHGPRSGARPRRAAAWAGAGDVASCAGGCSDRWWCGWARPSPAADTAPGFAPGSTAGSRRARSGRTPPPVTGDVSWHGDDGSGPPCARMRHDRSARRCCVAAPGQWCWGGGQAVWQWRHWTILHSAAQRSGSVLPGSGVDRTWATSLGRGAAQPTAPGPLRFKEIALQG